MANRRLLPPDVLRQLLDYDPITGMLTWKHREASLFAQSANPSKSAAQWNGQHAGKEAFTHIGSHGYREGAIFKQGHLAHRVAWAIHYGEWPVVIDHINGDRLDNGIANLRNVTQSVNMRNMGGKRGKNTSGVTGVSFRADRNKWRARLMVDGTERLVGHFDTMEDAVEARNNALRQFGFSPRHGSLGP